MDAWTGVYVHLPFCPYICPYCDFAKWPHRRSAAGQYLRALHTEIAHRPSISAGRRFQSVYLGGGTPNTYAPHDIAALLDALRRHFPGPQDRETTIELNPELVTAKDLLAYRQAGVTRVSLGVQSFEPAEIRTLGRKHAPREVEPLVRAARAAGVRSVSIDLIFAVPGQTRESWLRSLRTAIALNVDHVSTYGLTVEAGTPYARWHQLEPQAFLDDEQEAELYDLAMCTLEGAGFEQYEISNFARPGHRSAHNAHYWTNDDYVGLGVGAASYLGGVRSVHTRDLQEYLTTVQSGEKIPGESEVLEGAKRAGEGAMLALRTSQGVSLDGFKERYGVDFLQFYAPIVERSRSQGLLEVDATHARLTRRGRFVANDVCADFVTFA